VGTEEAKTRRQVPFGACQEATRCRRGNRRKVERGGPLRTRVVKKKAAKKRKKRRKKNHIGTSKHQHKGYGHQMKNGHARGAIRSNREKKKRPVKRR